MLFASQIYRYIVGLVGTMCVTQSRHYVEGMFVSWTKHPPIVSFDIPVGYYLFLRPTWVEKWEVLRYRYSGLVRGTGQLNLIYQVW